MSYDAEMAQMMRDAYNKPPPAGYHIGPIVSLSPLTISLMDGEIMATGAFLEISETIARLMQKLPDCTFNGCDCGGNCTHQCFPKPLKVGDLVICIGHNRFCALDRVG